MTFASLHCSGRRLSGRKSIRLFPKKGGSLFVIRPNEFNKPQMTGTVVCPRRRPWPWRVESVLPKPQTRHQDRPLVSAADQTCGKTPERSEARWTVWCRRSGSLYPTWCNNVHVAGRPSWCLRAAVSNPSKHEQKMSAKVWREGRLIASSSHKTGICFNNGSLTLIKPRVFLVSHSQNGCN